MMVSSGEEDQATGHRPVPLSGRKDRRKLPAARLQPIKLPSAARIEERRRLLANEDKSLVHFDDDGAEAMKLFCKELQSLKQMQNQTAEDHGQSGNLDAGAKSQAAAVAESYEARIKVLNGELAQLRKEASDNARLVRLMEERLRSSEEAISELEEQVKECDAIRIVNSRLAQELENLRKEVHTKNQDFSAQKSGHSRDGETEALLALLEHYKAENARLLSVQSRGY